MKNLFKALSILLVVITVLSSLSLAVFANEPAVTTAAETQAEEVTTASGEVNEETPTTGENAPKKSNIEMFLETLPIMGIGMAGVFIVIGIIILVTTALTKIFTKK